MIMRRFMRAPAMVLCLLALGFVLDGTAQAQDMAGDLKQGIELLRRGRTQEANSKFRAVLAADPGSDDAYQLVKETEHKILLDMLVAGGDAQLVAKRLLDLSQRAELERSRDDAAIQSLVSSAVRGRDPQQTLQARRDLAAKHGEYAVPRLVGFLGSNDTMERTNAILALRAMGADAIAPLAASVGMGNATQQRNTALLLESMGDDRAKPALMAAKGDKAKAAKAYVALSKSLFTGDPAVLRNYDGSYVVWRQADGKLVGVDVPRFLYRYELAEQAAYDALAADASNGAAKSMIALTAFAEIAAFEALSDEARASEDMAAVAGVIGHARALANSVGADGLGRALNMAVELGHGEAAAEVAGAMPRVWNGGEIGADNALVKALDARDKAIRYAAANALLHMSPDKAFPKSNEVAAIAGAAAGEAAIKQVLVVDSNSKNAAAVQRALNAAGYHAVAATSGADGLVAAKATGAFDAVVLAHSLDDMTSFQVLDELARDFRTERMVRIVMADGGSMAQAQSDYASRNVTGVARATDDGRAVVGTVNTAMQDANADEAQARANAQSIAASHALAAAHGAAFDLSAAQGGLMKALNDTATDEVRVAALAALANVANADAESALARVLADAENSVAVRAGAGNALAQALAGRAPAAQTFTALLNAMGDADAGVAAAAGAAFGAAKLSDEQQAKVLMKQRVM